MCVNAELLPTMVQHQPSHWPVASLQVMHAIRCFWSVLDFVKDENNRVHQREYVQQLVKLQKAWRGDGHAEGTRVGRG